MGIQIMILCQCCDGGRIGGHEHGINGTYYLKTGENLTTEPTRHPPEKKLTLTPPMDPLDSFFFYKTL
jgi:hypothetical protein